MDTVLRRIVLAATIAVVVPGAATRAFGTGAAAQVSGVFDMGALTNTMAQGAVVQSERERAKRGGGGRTTKISRAKALAAGKAALVFRPDAAARKRNLAAFADRIGANDPASAKNLRATFASTDVIGQTNGLMRKIGLNPYNVADTMAAYLVTAWHASRGNTAENAAEFRAVAVQLARAAGANPKMLRVSNAVKQETAESMLLSTLLVDASLTAAKKNPSTLPGVRAAVRQGARSTFGFDLAKLKLGPNGLS